MKAGRWAISDRHAVGPTTAATPGLWRWVLVLFLVLAATAACSESVPAIQPRAVSAMPEAPEIRIQTTASVFITESPEQTIQSIDSIHVTPSAIVLDPGETVQLSAQALGVNGQPLPDIQFVWSTTDQRVGTVTKNGRFQAGTSPGTFANSITVTGIQNTLDGIKYATGFASISVVGQARLPTLATVAIIPEDPTLLKQQIFRLRALGFDDNGMVIPGVQFVWKLSDPTLGRLDALGYLTVRGDEGTFEEAITVTGVWEGERLSASIDIQIVSAPAADDFLDVHALPQRFYLDPGDRLQLRAVALNGLGELVAGTQLRWFMVDSGAGTIDGSGNFIAGSTPGIFTEAVRVEAVVPGESGFVRAVDFASVVIREPRTFQRLSALSVAPGTALLAPGGRATLVPRAVDEFGEPAENVNISWELLKPEAGNVGAFGLFRAGNIPGTYSEALRVTAEQVLGDVAITRTTFVEIIVTGTLSRTEAHPALAVVAPGRTVHFSITGWDENGVELPGLVVTWRVADESVGSIDAFGNFTASRASGLYENAIIAEISQRIPDLR